MCHSHFHLHHPRSLKALPTDPAVCDLFDPTWCKCVKVVFRKYLASITLSVSSLPHSQSLPGSTAKCRGSILCSESVRGITTADRDGEKYSEKKVQSSRDTKYSCACVGFQGYNCAQKPLAQVFRVSPVLSSLSSLWSHDKRSILQTQSSSLQHYYLSFH